MQSSADTALSRFSAFCMPSPGPGTPALPMVMSTSGRAASPTQQPLRHCSFLMQGSSHTGQPLIQGRKASGLALVRGCPSTGAAGDAWQPLRPSPPPNTCLATVAPAVGTYSTSRPLTLGDSSPFHLNITSSHPSNVINTTHWAAR